MEAEVAMQHLGCSLTLARLKPNTGTDADSFRFSNKQKQKAKKKAATVSESGMLSHFSILDTSSLSLSDSGTESI